MPSDYKNRFFELALHKGNLRFGEFTLKSGRVSPYFFNAGGFDDGKSLAELADCYADAITESGVEFDMLFGPAYKGIPLAAAVAISLSRRHHRNVPFAYNRKEAKDHGEGGVTVGAPLSGHVLIVDDVISAGTSARESIDLIEAAGARPSGVAIALDRQERGEGDTSATTELSQRFHVPCIAIANLDDLIVFLSSTVSDTVGIMGDGEGQKPKRPKTSTIREASIDLDAIHRYRDRYGA